MTSARQSLIKDAKAAGYSIELQRDGAAIHIVKRIGRWRKPVGLVIYGDGTAFMLDVRSDVAKGIRSHKDMRSILGI
jgi:hypothetical protein